MDVFARAILEFTQESIIVPLIIIGYIWLNRSLFYQAICLVLANMILNVALKSTFKVPLSPALNKKGFAFPSGHMQTSSALYGFLFASVKKRFLKILCAFLIVAIGYSLMHFNYHTLLDVVGALFFAVMSIFAYQFLRCKTKPRTTGLILLVFTAAILTYINAISQIPQHAWMAFYALLGLVIAQMVFETRVKDRETMWVKCISTVFCFAFIFLINSAFLKLPEEYRYLGNLRWFFSGLFVPFSVFLSSRMYRSK